MTSNEIYQLNEKKSGTRPGWHHVGADLEIHLFQALRAEARENGVPYSVVIRWALQSYLHERLNKSGEAA